MNNFMEELFNAVPSLEELVKNGTFDENGYHYKDGNTEIHMIIKNDEPEKEKTDSDLKNDFIEWVDEIDDELFSETCEVLGPTFVKEFDAYLDKENYEEEVLAKYIETFCETYENLLDKKVTDLHFAFVNECEEIQKEADAKKEEARKQYETLIKKYTED